MRAQVSAVLPRFRDGPQIGAYRAKPFPRAFIPAIRASELLYSREASFAMKGVRKTVSLPLQPHMQPPLLQYDHPPRPRVTFLLVVTVAAVVIGSTSQFGYNTGVLNNPRQV